MNLQGFDAFNGLSISRDADGNIDPMQDLFRTDWPGVSSGPVVSQFMLADFDIDGIVVQPKANTLVPEVEFMTGVDTWLNVQVKMSSVDGLSSHIRMSCTGKQSKTTNVNEIRVRQAHFVFSHSQRPSSK